MKNKIVLISIGIILIVATFLRFYKINEIPPSLNWDEVSVGYNAWTIINYGQDEWGRKFPLAFKAFGEYKLPVHIYITSVFVKILGLNEFGVRIPIALFGVFNVYIIYLLGSKIFKSRLLGLVAASTLAISPYHIHFSRFNHEINFALFFLFLGIYLFLLGIEKKNFLLFFGYASLGIDLLTYNAAKIIVPPVFLLLTILYFKDLWKIKKWSIMGIVCFLAIGSLLLIEPKLQGGERFKEITVSTEQLQLSEIYKKTNSLVLARLDDVKNKYRTYFSYQYLFESGDPNVRLSPQVTGEFYKLDLVFLAVGAVMILWGIIKNRKKEYLLIFTIALLAPLPGTLGSEFPHAARGMFMIISWHLVVALGIVTLLNLFKRDKVKILVGLILMLGIGYYAQSFVEGYYQIYPNRYAIEWQYGMKQIVQFVRDHPEYDEVYTTAERQQPYIFYLFYLRYPLPKFLSTVSYNETRSRSANLVGSFGKYHFGPWDPIESRPIPYVLYIVTPSEYSGLRYKLLFDTVYEIKYPNGAEAFYLVSAPPSQ